MLTIDSFYQKLRDLTQANRFCIAFSGGLDSAVLLHLFYRLTARSDLHLRAVHVHHGLSSNADQWALACEEICARYQIPIITQHIYLQKTAKISLEELARTKRYGVFRELLQGDEILVTAHHQNDQAETLLLQLFRGAGPKGLASMPPIASFGKGFLVRPLLTFTKESLQEYALKEQLKWQEDESNQNINFDRNFLRHTLLPTLQSRWPAIIKNLARAAKHCGQANHYIENQIVPTFKQVYMPEKKSLLISLLLATDVETQNYIIRYWLQYLNLPLPSANKLRLLQNEILNSREDRVPLLRWNQVEVRRYDNHLYAMAPLLEHNPKLIINWDLQADLMLPNNIGFIKLIDLQQLGLDLSHLQAVTIRFRQGGEKCRLKNRQHTHSLKKLFQEWRVPPWMRDRVPLLYSNNTLKAIVGFIACE